VKEKRLEIEKEGNTSLTENKGRNFNMDMTKLLGLPEGGDYILLNQMYHKPKRDGDDMTPDAISLIIKNIKTGEKQLKIIENPQIEAYVAKDDVQIDYPMICIEADKVNKVDLSYRYVLKDIAGLIGEQAVNQYWQMIKERRSSELKNFHKWNRIFSSDVDVEDFYKFKCLEHFGTKEKFKLTKGFLDIEADIYAGNIDMKNVEGSAPINAVTLVDNDKKQSFTLLLRNSENPLIAEFEQDIPGFIEEIEAEFEPEFGKLEYHIIMCDTEIELIRKLFQIINIIRVDFMMVWNLGFDFQYIMHRIERLGIDPEDIMTDEAFKYKECWYYADKRNFKINRKGDYATLTSFTVWVDQMINYAAIRKSGAELDSYKLDYIGDREVGAKKLEYTGTANFRNLPYVDYKMFVRYNIRDVLIQMKIENKLNDIELLFNKAYDSSTRFNKTYKETVFLRNKAAMEFQEQGLVMGNNHNITYGESSGDSENQERFEGAVVGDPKLNLPTGMNILKNYQSRNVFNNVMDFDYSSLYPSIIMIFNIFATTQLGRVIMDNRNITKREVITDMDKYDRGGKFIEDLELNEPVQFMHRWMGMPSAEDMLEEFGHELGERAIRKARVQYVSKVKKDDKKKNKKGVEIRKVKATRLSEKVKVTW